MIAQASPGICLRCAKTFSKASMGAHLAASLVPAKTTSSTTQLLLFVEAFSPYWLYVLASSTTTLRQLDTLLRRTWLECCGHLSAFTINRQRYASHPATADEGLNERSLSARLESVMPRQKVFTYEYDFSSTTMLTLKAVKEWPGPAQKLKVVATNDEPTFPCSACGSPAELVCPVCSDDDAWCTKCSAKHECEALLPVVNSPRRDVCVYAGPTEP